MHGDRQDSVLPMEESISRFEELYDCGVRYGVRLAQENVVRFRSSDNAYLRAMRDRLGEKAHFVLDLKQAVRCGHTLDDVIEAMGNTSRMYTSVTMMPNRTACRPDGEKPISSG